LTDFKKDKYAEKYREKGSEHMNVDSDHYADEDEEGDQDGVVRDVEPSRRRRNLLRKRARRHQRLVHMPTVKKSTSKLQVHQFTYPLRCPLS